MNVQQHKIVQTFLQRSGAQVAFEYVRSAVNNLSDVAFVVGMTRTNLRSATAVPG